MGVYLVEEEVEHVDHFLRPVGQLHHLQEAKRRRIIVVILKF